MKVFVSTSSLWHLDLETGIPNLFHAGYDGVELSRSPKLSGIDEKIMRWRRLGELSIHNYFPRPEVDFVFNLASQNAQIASRSMEHAKTVIKLADQNDMRWVSFHAGYLIDPSPIELGGVVRYRQPIHRPSALASFTKRAKDVVAEAESKGIVVLWENNVLSAANYSTYADNPFLLVDPDEILFFASEIADSSGILLDLAHLSVSCAQLSINRALALDKLGPAVRGLHLSEDNGETDDGELLREDSWFWGKIPTNIDYCVVESRFRNYTDAQQQLETVRKCLSVNHEGPGRMSERETP